MRIYMPQTEENMTQLSFEKKLMFIDYAIKELEKGVKAKDIGICLIYVTWKYSFVGDCWTSLGKRFPELRQEIDKVLKRQEATSAVLDYTEDRQYSARIQLLKRVKKQLLK